MVPAGGRISFADIAKQTPLTEQMVTRLLRHAMMMRIFYKPKPGFVAHTKASKIFINPVTNDWLITGTEEMWPASTKTVEALEKWPGSEEPRLCIENNTTDSIYAFLGAHSERAGRFANAMVSHLKKPEHDPKYITDYVDWASLREAQVTHLGVGPGIFAMALAKQHSNLKVVVQDMAFMMGLLKLEHPSKELKGKVTFEPHDFFAPQTTSADVFCFRWTYRNWAYKYSILALKAQLPVLKPGNRLIIQDNILPEPGTGPAWREKAARSGDLSLATSFNSRDRTVADWKKLVQEADPSFVFMNFTLPKGSALGILEFVWEGKA
ncbi:hypothetical protein BOTCAL_0989g00010 [Botryotinia calthae]|uniref:O-methyltransferase C-terminal domain-containing protein n=1 Tax=Botryotinia calthae TaxID=38488 RepID=A0A4Y8CGU5_9HELO|nr:hypothetical protein BOTCAL_0989g00010 [Botryotinia calthae]